MTTNPYAPYPAHTAAYIEPRYGWSLHLDMEHCDSAALDDSAIIRGWVGDLVKRIGMIPFGEPTIQHFGHADPVTAGYTLVQLIETSSIVAHFSPFLLTLHLDLFSCREFDPATVIELTEEMFGGDSGHATLLPRG